jgi:septal ring factor EnvC (AmiA/AmiB activator)
VRRPDVACALPAALLAACFGLAVQAADKAPTAGKLEKVEQQIEATKERKDRLAQDAAELASEAAKLRAQAIELAGAIQEREEEVSELETRLEHLGDLEKDLLAALERRRQQMTSTLGAIERIARRPPEALAFGAGTPADQVRSAMLLSRVAPALRADAEALGRELGELTALRQDIEAERENLAKATEALKGERATLARLAERKARELRRSLAEARAEDQRLGRLAAEATDLRSLLAKIEEAETRRAEKEAEKERVALAGPTGNLPLPARGDIVRRFGQANEVGQPARGLSIRTRREAQVVAPFEGEVVFAGPFRGFGLLLITAHADGYHSLLAGFGRIDVAVGQNVHSGEPVGQMGEDAAPTLYVELRRKGDPVNPLPWLAASKRKVSG